MLYREAGQFKTNYRADMAVFPLLQDRIGIFLILLIAFAVIPFVGSNFFLHAIMIPFLIFALATIGLNILTGYTGLLSLGSQPVQDMRQTHLERVDIPCREFHLCSLCSDAAMMPRASKAVRQASSFLLRENEALAGLVDGMSAHRSVLVSMFGAT